MTLLIFFLRSASFKTCTLVWWRSTARLAGSSVWQECPFCKLRHICLDSLPSCSETRQHVWLYFLLRWTVYKHQKYVMILICCCGTAGMSTRDSCSIEPFVQGHGSVGLQAATINPNPGTVVLVVWTSSVWPCSQELPRSCAATCSLSSLCKLAETTEIRRSWTLQGISRLLQKVSLSPLILDPFSSQGTREKGSINDTSWFIHSNLPPPFSNHYLPVRLPGMTD